MKTLNQYLNEKKIRQEDFARSVDLTQATISRFSRGVANPSLDVAIRISAATGGEVSISSWPNIAAVINAASKQEAKL